MEYTCVYSLAHHGIKGQRWGVRRFQNKDGSYTPAGKKRYDSDDYESKRENRKKIAKRVAIGAAIVGGTALVVLNRKKLSSIASSFKQQIVAEKALAKKVDLNEKLPKKVTPPPIPKKETDVKKLYENNSLIKDLERRGIETPFATPKTKETTSTPKLVFKQEIPKAETPRTETTKKDTRSFSERIKDFKFKRHLALRPDGTTEAFDFPEDKKGYAKAFAESMALSEGSEKNYSYWYNYMLGKLHYDPSVDK